MDPLMMLLGAMLLKGRSAPSSAPPPTKNGHHRTNGNGLAHATGSVLLTSGKTYRFLATLESNAPAVADVRELLKLVHATDIKVRTRPPATVSFTVKMPLDVPFTPGSAHPQAPWLTLQSVEELEQPPSAVPPRKKKRARK